MKGVTRIRNVRAIGLRNGDKGTWAPVGRFEDKVKMAWITRGWCTVENFVARHFSTVSKKGSFARSYPLSHAGVDRRTKGGNTDLP
jgi:hypothetical protein